MIKKTFILAAWICAATQTAAAKDFLLERYAESMKDKVFILKAPEGILHPAGRSVWSGRPIFDYYLAKSDLNEQPNWGGGQNSVHRYELRDANYTKKQDMLEVKFKSLYDAEVKLYFLNASRLSKADFANLMGTIFLTDSKGSDDGYMLDNFKKIIKGYFEKTRRSCQSSKTGGR